MPPKYELYSKLDTMLTPETLSKFTEGPVTSIERVAKDWGGFSGSHLEAITVNGEEEPRFVVKRLSPEWDWKMRVGNDQHCRELTIWQYGILDMMPPEVNHAVIAGANDGSGWAILLRNVSDTFIRRDGDLTHEENEAYLESLAAMHANFWEHPRLMEAEIGLGNIDTFLAVTNPERCLPEAPSALLPEAVIEGWAYMENILDEDVVQIIQPLLKDWQELQVALNNTPKTLIHCDPVIQNIGMISLPDNKVVALDWQEAAVASPLLDLGTYINAAPLPLVTYNEAINYYRRALERRLGTQFEDARWQYLVDVAFLAVFLRVGWASLYWISKLDDEAKQQPFRKALNWWSERVRVGAKALYQ